MSDNTQEDITITGVTALMRFFVDWIIWENPRQVSSLDGTEDR